MSHVGHVSQVPFAKQDTVELPSGLYPVLQLITAISPYVVLLLDSTTSALTGVGSPQSINNENILKRTCTCCFIGTKFIDLYETR